MRCVAPVTGAGRLCSGGGGATLQLDVTHGNRPGRGSSHGARSAGVKGRCRSVGRGVKDPRYRTRRRRSREDEELARFRLSNRWEWGRDQRPQFPPPNPHPLPSSLFRREPDIETLLCVEPSEGYRGQAGPAGAAPSADGHGTPGGLSAAADCDPGHPVPGKRNWDQRSDGSGPASHRARLARLELQPPRLQGVLQTSGAGRPGRCVIGVSKVRPRPFHHRFAKDQRERAMSTRRLSFTERRRARLAVKPLADQLEIKNTITEPISVLGLSVAAYRGLAPFGVTIPDAGAAASGLAPPVRQRVKPGARQARRSPLRPTSSRS